MLEEPFLTYDILDEGENVLQILQVRTFKEGKKRNRSWERRSQWVTKSGTYRPLNDPPRAITAQQGHALLAKAIERLKKDPGWRKP